MISFAFFVIVSFAECVSCVLIQATHLTLQDECNGIDRRLRFFVHGIPDTDVVWEPLLSVIATNDDDTFENIAVELPGYGSSANGLETGGDYLEWLIGHVEDAVANRQTSTCLQKVDIVGHDVGGILTWGLVNERPDLVRSWTVVAAPIWPGYEWHIFARIFQTPVLGTIVAYILGIRPIASTMLVLFGVPLGAAWVTAGNIDGNMVRQVVRFYETTPEDIGDQWFQPNQLDTSRAAFVFGEKDIFMAIEDGVAFGQQIGVRSVVISDVGHWVMLEAPHQLVGVIHR